MPLFQIEQESSLPKSELTRQSLVLLANRRLLQNYIRFTIPSECLLTLPALDFAFTKFDASDQKEKNFASIIAESIEQGEKAVKNKGMTQLQLKKLRQTKIKQEQQREQTKKQKTKIREALFKKQSHFQVGSQEKLKKVSNHKQNNITKQEKQQNYSIQDLLKQLEQIQNDRYSIKGQIYQVLNTKKQNNKTKIVQLNKQFKENNEKMKQRLDLLIKSLFLLNEDNKYFALQNQMQKMTSFKSFFQIQQQRSVIVSPTKTIFTRTTATQQFTISPKKMSLQQHKTNPKALSMKNSRIKQIKTQNQLMQSEKESIMLSLQQLKIIDSIKKWNNFIFLDSRQMTTI